MELWTSASKLTRLLFYIRLGIVLLSDYLKLEKQLLICLEFIYSNDNSTILYFGYNRKAKEGGEDDRERCLSNPKMALKKERISSKQIYERLKWNPLIYSKNW